MRSELAAAGYSLCSSVKTFAGWNRLQSGSFSGGFARALAADVRESSWLHELDALFPRVDVLVNNASAYAPFALVENGVENDFAQVHATVVDGARRLIQHVLPGMKKRGFGRIVNIGSLASELGGAGQAAYASAKAALVGLTRTVAVEAARHGVTVNVVQPGLIDTERIAEAVDNRTRERILSGVPLRRIGTPEEVAYTVAFSHRRAAATSPARLCRCPAGWASAFSRAVNGDNRTVLERNNSGILLEKTNAMRVSRVIELIEESTQSEPGTIHESTRLLESGAWDSMSMVMFMGSVFDEAGVNLTDDEMRECATPVDLAEAIAKRIGR